MLAGLRGAFSKTPFGDPAELAPSAANSLTAWSDSQLKQVQQTRFDRGDAAKLLGVLLKDNADVLLDFDSARQVAWAARVLLDELRPRR